MCEAIRFCFIEQVTTYTVYRVQSGRLTNVFQMVRALFVLRATCLFYACVAPVSKTAQTTSSHTL